MSTKTTIKRIALVAVSALGMGLMPVVPASAAVSAITAVTLQEVTAGAADTSLVVVQAGSSTTRASAVTVYTNGSKIDLTDLELVVSATYGAASDLYYMLLSPDSVSAGSSAGSFTNSTAATASANTNASAGASTRVLGAFGTVTGTYSGLTTGSDDSTARRGLSLGTHYLYVAPTSSTDYVGAEDWKITITVANPTMTDVAPVIANSSTTLAGRVGQQVSIPVTSTNSLLAAGSGARPFMRFATAITTQPSSSDGTVVYPTLTAGSATINTTFTRYDKSQSVSAGSTLEISASASSRGTAANSTGASSVLYTTTAASGAQAAAVTTAQEVGTVTFTPVATGTYTLVVWAESTDTGFPALSGSESYKVFTINVSAGVSTVTLTPQNTTSSLSGSNGALVKVSLKDAAGNAAVLAPGEVVSLTPTGSGDIAKVNGSVVSSAAGASYSLSSANFNSSGIAWINMVDAAAAAEDVTLTASVNGGTSSSTTIAFKSTTATAAAAAPYAYGTSGFLASGSATSVGLGTKSVVFRLAATTDNYSNFTVTESLCSSVGTITGYTTALAYDVAALAASSVSSHTVTASCATAGTIYTVIESGTKTNTVAAAAQTAGVLTVNPTAVNAVVGSTNSLTATLKDNFGVAYASQTVTISVAGKNPTTTSATAVTDANGKVTYSLTDANTNTAVTDTVTFTSGSAVSVQISYGTNAVSTVTLTTDDTTASVANDSVSAQAIATGYAGAQGGARTVTATVKNAAGALLAGVPVTFTVSGTGAAVTSTTQTVYTSTSGTASASVYAWISGTYTVTATAGGKSGTGTETFYSTGNGSVRTVSATANGNQVIGKATDRFGNPVANAQLYAKITSGSGNIAGSLTAQGTTDLAGTVTWVVSDGAASVTVSNISFSSPAGTVVGQTGAAKGYDIGGADATALTAATVGTTTTAETGVGSSYDAAGVATATADATPATSSDAIDAANEATDAANAATDAANAAAEAADAATAAAQDAQAAVAALATEVASMISGIKAQIIRLTNLVVKIQKKVNA